MSSSSFAPLRRRNFSLALSSSFISSIGTWMQSVAMGVYLTETTHNNIWLGLMTAAGWLPSIVGSPIGGVIADRRHRQSWIQLQNVVMALTAITLAVLQLTHHLQPLVCVLLAIVEGVCSSASWAAWQSLLPDLVGEGEVLAAVSLSSAQFNLGRIFGPMVAGIVLAVASPGWCFAANAASFVAVVVIFSFVRTTPRNVHHEVVSFAQQLRQGARAAWSQPSCRYAIVAVGVVAILLSPFIALIPSMAIQTLHSGRVGTSWMMMAQGLGAVMGAVSVPNLARRTSRRFVSLLSATGMCCGVIAYGASPNLWAASLLLVVMGASYIGILSGLNTAVQLHAPLAERSRILALYTMSLSICFPIGALIQAALSHLIGLRAVTSLFGVVALLGLIAIALWRPQIVITLSATPDTKARQE